MKKRVALVAIVFTLAIPAVAGGTIVIGDGMFGVRLGATMGQVRHALGRPSQVDHRAGASAWSYDALGLVVDFSTNRRVHDLSTISPSQRTPNGVGVGSSEIALMRLVPGVHCSPRAHDSQDVDCTVASGNVVTDFQLTTPRYRVHSVLITRQP
jgi:hypothetical protein